MRKNMNKSSINTLTTMKNRILLSLLTCGVLLAGCSKNEGGDLADGGLTAIRLGSGVATVSKAAVTEGTAFTAGIAGWENTNTENYANAPTWNTSIQTTANATTGQDVTWTAQQYYNANGNTTTYMKAWYPAGTLSGTSVSFDNTDGSVDALFAPVVSGTKADKNNAKTLAFAHQTAQISFKVQAGNGLAANTTLSSITIKNAELPTGFNLSTDVATYASAADLTVPGITTGATTISQTAAAVGSAVMIKPISGKTFTIDVVTNNATYSDQTVTVNTDNIEAGTAYEVTLTFGQPGIELTSSITPWTAQSHNQSIQ